MSAPHAILGVDPGTATMGWGVLRKDGSRVRYVQHGAITTDASWEMPRRLSHLFDALPEIISGYKPEALAVEDLFMGRNVSTAISVGQVRGVVLLAAHRTGLVVFEYTPLQVKQAITSYGRAPKRQVQEMVKHLLNLTETHAPTPPPTDLP